MQVCGVSLQCGVGQIAMHDPDDSADPLRKYLSGSAYKAMTDADKMRRTIEPYLRLRDLEESAGTKLARQYLNAEAKLTREFGSSAAYDSAKLLALGKSPTWARTIGGANSIDLHAVFGLRLGSTVGEMREAVMRFDDLAADRNKAVAILGMNDRLAREFDTTCLKMSAYKGITEMFDFSSALQGDACGSACKKDPVSGVIGV